MNRPEIDLARHQQRACISKRYFEDKASAKAEAKAIGKRKGTKLRPYACHFCDGYHLTSHSLANIEGIQQTFGEAWAAARRVG